MISGANTYRGPKQGVNERLEVGSNCDNKIWRKNHHLTNYYTFCINVLTIFGLIFQKIIKGGYYAPKSSPCNTLTKMTQY